MKPYYAKQIIEFNEEGKKFIKLDAEWILGIENDAELGKQVRNKMIDKIKELDEYTEKLKKDLL